MKKAVKFIVCVVLICVLITPFGVLAKENKQSNTVDAPTLQSIEFNDAEIDGEFVPTEFYYKISVSANGETPTLKRYEVSKGSEIFVTYNQSEGMNGINVEVKNDTRSTNYFFEYIYSDADVTLNSNNNLKELDCKLGCVYPSLNSEETSYQLYIPSDMTQLKLAAVPEDMGAHCNVPKLLKMNSEQSPTFEASVIATDGTVKVYTFEVKRLDITSKELKKELKNNSYEDIIKNEVFHKSPRFKMMIFGILGGIIVLLIAVMLLKRVAIKAQDDDETEFFDSYRESEKEEQMI